MKVMALRDRKNPGLAKRMLELGQKWREGGIIFFHEPDHSSVTLRVIVLNPPVKEAIKGTSIIVVQYSSLSGEMHLVDARSLDEHKPHPDNQFATLVEVAWNPGFDNPDFSSDNVYVFAAPPSVMFHDRSMDLSPYKIGEEIVKTLNAARENPDTPLAFVPKYHNRQVTTSGEIA